MTEEERTMSDVEEEEEDDEEEELDPRVQAELERLNFASGEINKLESELEHARTKFRSFLTESTKELNLLYKKLGKCVVKVRPYFAMLKDLQKAQAEAQRSVVKYQRANSIYKAAREMVALAEERVTDPDGNRRDFDSAWQEMLNHATTKFMESEVEKARSEEEHMKRASECAEISNKLKEMEKEWHRSIPRSRPYYEVKERAEYMLAQEKQNVEDIQLALQLAKQNYREALGKLEEISEEVHRKRKFKKNLPPRTPGVGAENDDDISVSSDLPSICLDSHLERGDSFSDLYESDVASEDGWMYSDDSALPTVPEQSVTEKSVTDQSAAGQSIPKQEQSVSKQTVLPGEKHGLNAASSQPVDSADSREPSSNAAGSAPCANDAANHGTSSQPEQKNLRRYSESAILGVPQTSTAQLRLQPAAKTTSRLPVVPPPSHLSVLSVQDLLAGEPCERVTRQIQSINLQNHASDPMKFVKTEKKSHSESHSESKSVLAAKTIPKDSTDGKKSVGHPISERESSKADGRELKDTDTESSRQLPHDSVDFEKSPDTATNNNTPSKESKEKSAPDSSEIFV